jgi:hypothetical protein
MNINNQLSMFSSNLKNHCQLLIYSHIKLKIVKNKDLKSNNRFNKEIKWVKRILINLLLS